MSRSVDAPAAPPFGARSGGSSSNIPATRSAWNAHEGHVQIQPVSGLIAAPQRGHSDSNTERAGSGATGWGTVDSAVMNRFLPWGSPLQPRQS
jgi:hypothetical protein